MQQGSSNAATLTDEQIVGLDPVPADAYATTVAQGAPSADPEAFPFDASDPSVILSEAKDLSADAATDDPLSDDPAASRLSSAESRRQVELSAHKEDPAWLRTLESQPQGGREAAAEARAWRAAASDVAALDAAYFSASPDARAGLAARLYDSDPATFRAMLAESARMLSQRDPQALAELARQLGAPPNAAAPRVATPSLRAAASVAQGADARAFSERSSGPEAFSGPVSDGAIQRMQNPQGPVPTLRDGRPELQNTSFPAEAYRSFEAATNEDVARRVNQAIDHTLSNTLPEGTAEGARRRIAADIFQEVHASLAADRDLARRVGETLRDWRFDAAARQQVASLLSGRARAVLPEVVRRVVTEWTSSVLASDRAKSARIEAASARREVTGGRLPEPVPPGALRPRNIDYRRLSDDQILDL